VFPSSSLNSQDYDQTCAIFLEWDRLSSLHIVPICTEVRVWQSTCDLRIFKRISNFSSYVHIANFIDNQCDIYRSITSFIVSFNATYLVIRVLKQSSAINFVVVSDKWDNAVFKLRYL